jgi:integrase
LVYFGAIDDPQAALEKWLKEKDELLAGRQPRSSTGEVTLADLANQFLTAKRALVENKELSQRTLADAFRVCKNMIEFWGKNRLADDFQPADFAAYRVHLSHRLRAVSLGIEIQRVRSVFKFAFESGVIAQQVRFGPGFKRPSKRVVRMESIQKGSKLFTHDELHKLLAVASVPMAAMILLGCNGGFGNTDCATLPIDALDLDRGWISYLRPKTGISRRFALWQETIDAIRKVLDHRPEPKDAADSDLLFITKQGHRWIRFDFCRIPPSEAGEAEEPKFKTNSDDAIAKEFRKLFDKAGIARNGRSFYTLRHVFETIAGDSRDQIAVNHVMGHVDPSMAAIYREKVEDERLKAVCQHVHNWLYGEVM